MVELQPSKLVVRVRFPSPAPFRARGVGRFVDLDLPPDWDQGYVASWRGKVGFVKGTPSPVPALPRWMLTIPNPNRAKRLTRFASRVCLTVGIISLVVGVVYLASGTPGGW